MPGQAAVAGVVAVVSLLGKDMLGDDRLAGLGSAAFTTGSAIIAIPLAAQMKRRGRRSGLVMALSLGVLGSAVAAIGGQLEWFWLFIVGMVMFGCGQAATLQSRYVAADLARDRAAGDRDRQRRVGRHVGAVFGPLLTPFEKRCRSGARARRVRRAVLFAGLFFGIGAVIFWPFLRPDPLVVIGGTDPHAERVRPLRQLRASYGVIRSSPGRARTGGDGDESRRRWSA